MSVLKEKKFNSLLLGYAHRHCHRKLLIPQDIIDMIFKYQKPAWDMNLSHDALDINDGMVIHSKRSTGKYLCSFGIQDIKFGKSEWKIKIHSVPSHIKIGIIGTSKVSKTLNTFCDNASGYGYHSDGQKRNKNWSKYGKRLNEGDVLTIILDMDNATLSYKHNNQHLGVAFEIDKSISYRFVVESYGTGDQYQML